jgi:acyl-CoA thioester hydrolase
VSERKVPHDIASYPFFHSIDTRWMDNDVYGHVNNVIYYSYFDTAVAAFLMERAGLDYIKSPLVGLVIETSCTYFDSIAFPDRVTVGLRIAKLGVSSVRYEVAVFKNNNTTACAQGYFVHVYVDRESNRPTPIPDQARSAMQALMAATPSQSSSTA